MTKFNSHSNFQPWQSEIKLNNVLIPSLFPKLTQKGVYILKKSNVPSKNSGPKKIAVCFSGGPAPGGHSVVASIARQCASSHTLLGVLNGPKGLLNNEFVKLDPQELQAVDNTGGFHLLGTDRTKIKTQDQFNTIKNNVKQHNIDGIIFIGGDDTHTNAVFLAESLYDLGCSIVGVPKTIDGDLRYDPYLPLPFGFSTAVDVYANLVKNIIVDTQSTKKYWHFIKLMGRTTSHVTQQVGKIAQPDICLISEKLATSSTRLPELIHQITSQMVADYTKNKPYGVICFSEGILEFLPDITRLIQQLNSLLKTKGYSRFSILERLSPENKITFEMLPDYIQNQLLLDRDSHGNINLSRIDTERLLIQLCNKELLMSYPTTLFQCIPHFYGYEARCERPNSQDQLLCEHLGKIAFDLVINNHTGYMAAFNPVDNTKQHYAVPIIAMLEEQPRLGNQHVVVKKVLVD